MATTTADKKPTLDEVVAELAAIKPEFEKLKALAANPDFGRVRHVSADGKSESEWLGQDDEELTVKFSGDDGIIPGYKNHSEVRKAMSQEHRKNIRLMKKVGYKGLDQSGDKNFKSFGDFIRFGVNNRKNLGKIESAISDHMKPLLDYYSADDRFKAIQGMSTVVGADGGFTILPEFAPGLIDRIYQNNLFSMTDNYSVSGNDLTFLTTAETSRLTGSRAGGIQGYWMDEADALTKSKPTTARTTLKLHKLGILVYLTDELLADTGTALQSWITRKVGEEFNFMTGDALINGSGVAKPMGVLNCPSLVSISAEAGQTGASFQSENAVKMWSRLYAPSRANATWFKNQDVDPFLMLMTLGIGAAGMATYMPPGGLSGAPYGTLIGRPMMDTEFNATCGTTGDIILADLGQMLSISKGGIAQAVSMHVEFLTDQLALRFILRLNAGPWEKAAITPYKGSNTQSSFISLATR